MLCLVQQLVKLLEVFQTAIHNLNSKMVSNVTLFCVSESIKTSVVTLGNLFSSVL
jgi:hypothetical protein